jgi:hypothetical protein
MRPPVPLVAAGFATRMSEEFVPRLQGFSANNAAMMSAMLQMVSEEWDRAASRPVEENRIIRAILRRAAAVLGDASLLAHADGTDTDLRISSLDAANDALRRILTDVHARIENAQGPQARDVERAIWDELRASVERRRIGSANF